MGVYEEGERKRTCMFVRFFHNGIDFLKLTKITFSNKLTFFIVRPIRMFCYLGIINAKFYVVLQMFLFVLKHIYYNYQN